MLKPSIQELMKRVDNRYLLVNMAAQRARDISAEEETSEIRLEEKPIKMALDEICADKIEYRSGPKPEPAVHILAAVSAMNERAKDDDLLSVDEAEAIEVDIEDISLEDL